MCCSCLKQFNIHAESYTIDINVFFLKVQFNTPDYYQVGALSRPNMVLT